MVALFPVMFWPELGHKAFSSTPRAHWQSGINKEINLDTSVHVDQPFLTLSSREMLLNLLSILRHLPEPRS